MTYRSFCLISYTNRKIFYFAICCDFLYLSDYFLSCLRRFASRDTTQANCDWRGALGHKPQTCAFTCPTEHYTKPPAPKNRARERHTPQLAIQRYRKLRSKGILVHGELQRWSIGVCGCVGFVGDRTAGLEVVGTFFQPRPSTSCSLVFFPDGVYLV